MVAQPAFYDERATIVPYLLHNMDEFDCNISVQSSPMPCRRALPSITETYEAETGRRRTKVLDYIVSRTH